MSSPLLVIFFSSFFSVEEVVLSERIPGLVFAGTGGVSLIGSSFESYGSSLS